MNLKHRFQIGMIFLFCSISSLFSEQKVATISASTDVHITNLMKDFSDYVTNCGHKVVPVNPQTSSISDALKSYQYVFCSSSSLIEGVMASNIPGVYILVNDPKDKGLINYKGAPLTKLRGISVHNPPDKVLIKLKQIFPGKNKIGVVYNPYNTIREVLKIEEAASRNGFEIIGKTVSESGEVLKMFQSIINDVDFLMLIPDETVVNKVNFTHMMKASVFNRLPIIGFSENMTKAGNIISFHMNFKKLGKQAGALLVSMIDGKQDPEVALEYPEEVDYSINLKTAAIFKFNIPDAILKEATIVIKE